MEKAKFIGRKNDYPNLIVGKEYDVLNKEIDEYGDFWVLLRNENNTEKFYNTNLFEITINGWKFYRNPQHGKIVAYFPNVEQIVFDTDESFKKWLELEENL